MESMETVVEQKREAPKSVLDADDYREMAQFAQVLTGIRSSCSVVRILHLDEIKDHEGKAFPMIELNSMCKLVNTPRGL